MARKYRSNMRIIDLTHTLHPGFPRWPGDEPFRMVAVETVSADGFAINELRYWEHVGTHIDAPAHKVDGGMTVDLLDVEDLVAPLVVIDISTRPTLTVDDIAAWEQVNGRIPERAFVAMLSGSEQRLGASDAPGFDKGAVQFLVDERNIVGIGVDTLSVDPSASTDYAAHTALLEAGRYGVEALANLGAVPPVGATVVVGAPKHRGGSGGPCRVLAIV